MNILRAKEIMESAEPVEVRYNGKQVMIQHVDEKTEMARIYSRAHPEQEESVPLRMLQEG